MKLSFANILLTPFAWLYGAAVGLRNLLYDEGVLHTTTVRVPTICVGNLAVGGTGKTPHVEYIVRLLQGKGYHVAVLSRGYRRQTKGFVLATSASTASEIGDEPMQIHTKYPYLIVAVCENRVRGVRELMKMHPEVQCVVLDDAFQHRAIQCGLNILLTAADRLYTMDTFLPAGRLRDSRSQALRADMIVVSKCPKEMRPIDCRVVESCLRPAAYQRLFFSQMVYDSIPLPGKALVLAGIAHPEPLLDYVRQTQPDSDLMAFGDHHFFTKDDVARLRECAKQYTCVVTTEKDYARLRETELAAEWGDKLIVMPIRAEIRESAELFDQLILRYVSETLRKL